VRSSELKEPPIARSGGFFVFDSHSLSNLVIPANAGIYGLTVPHELKIQNMDLESRWG
jgi:hypothetical protein